MRQFRTPGPVRGAGRKACPYRDPRLRGHVRDAAMPTMAGRFLQAVVKARRQHQFDLWATATEAHGKIGYTHAKQPAEKAFVS